MIDERLPSFRERQQMFQNPRNFRPTAADDLQRNEPDETARNDTPSPKRKPKPPSRTFSKRKKGTHSEEQTNEGAIRPPLPPKPRKTTVELQQAPSSMTISSSSSFEEKDQEVRTLKREVFEKDKIICTMDSMMNQLEAQIGTQNDKIRNQVMNL